MVSICECYLMHRGQSSGLCLSNSNTLTAFIPCPYVFIILTGLCAYFLHCLDTQHISHPTYSTNQFLSQSQLFSVYLCDMRGSLLVLVNFDCCFGQCSYNHQHHLAINWSCSRESEQNELGVIMCMPLATGAYLNVTAACGPGGSQSYLTILNW